MSKYEFTGNSKVVNFGGESVLVREIRALTTFTASHAFIQKGTVGGWIESESNLSQKGTCWVDKDSVVLGDGKLLGKAYLKNGMISGKAKVTDALIDTSSIGGSTSIWGYSKISLSTIDGNTNLFGAIVIENSRLSDCYIGFMEGADETIRGNVYIDSCQLTDCDIEMFKDGELNVRYVKGDIVEMAVMSRTSLVNLHLDNVTDMRFHSQLDQWNILEGANSKELMITDSKIWMLDTKIYGQVSLNGILSFARTTVTDFAIINNKSNTRQNIVDSAILDMSSVIFERTITEDAKHKLNLCSDEQLIFTGNI